MKVTEHVSERRIRDKVKTDDIQFGFRPGSGTADAGEIWENRKDALLCFHRP